MEELPVEEEGIVGIIIGVVVVLLLVCAVSFCVFKCMQRKVRGRAQTYKVGAAQSNAGYPGGQSGRKLN